jgi:hypothetical protein
MSIVSASDPATGVLRYVSPRMTAADARDLAEGLRDCGLLVIVAHVTRAAPARSLPQA